MRDKLASEAPPPQTEDDLLCWIDSFLQQVENEPPVTVTLVGMGKRSNRVAEALYRGRVQGWKAAIAHVRDALRERKA